MLDGIEIYSIAFIELQNFAVLCSCIHFIFLTHLSFVLFLQQLVEDIFCAVDFRLLY